MAKDKSAPEESKEPKQVPEKPKGNSGIPGIVQLVGIISGTVVIMVIILFLAFKFLVFPDLKQLTGAGRLDSTAVGEKSKEELAKEAEKKKDAWMNEEDASFFQNDENTHFVETGRITTNPSGSTDRFVVINLGLIYLTKPGEKESGEEGGAAALSPTIIARIRGGVNMVLGKYTAEQIKSQQDSLPNVFKKELKPIFRQGKMLLKDVILQEIIIQ